jgi:hypothetical protein
VERVIEVARNFKAMDDTIYLGDAVYAYFERLRHRALAQQA